MAHLTSLLTFHTKAVRGVICLLYIEIKKQHNFVTRPPAMEGHHDKSLELTAGQIADEAIVSVQRESEHRAEITVATPGEIA